MSLPRRRGLFSWTDHLRDLWCLRSRSCSLWRSDRWWWWCLLLLDSATTSSSSTRGMRRWLLWLLWLPWLPGIGGNAVGFTMLSYVRLSMMLWSKRCLTTCPSFNMFSARDPSYTKWSRMCCIRMLKLERRSPPDVSLASNWWSLQNPGGLWYQLPLLARSISSAQQGCLQHLSFVGNLL